MLWYKAWLETRARFLISLCGMTSLGTWYAYNELHDASKFARAEWYFRVLHTGHTLLATMWVAAVLILMMGGLLRERDLGTAPFTLALPVSRGRLMRTRILVGILESSALAIVPWTALFVTVNRFGSPPVIPQALFHLLLLAGGGVVFFATAFLVSSSVEGEYTAPAVSIGLLFVCVFASDDRAFRDYNPFNFILGTEYLDRASQLLIGPAPWAHVFANILVSALLTALAIQSIQKKDF